MLGIKSKQNMWKQKRNKQKEKNDFIESCLFFDKIVGAINVSDDCCRI